MALSGSLTSSSYTISNGTRNLIFSWTASQSIVNNTSTISWTLKGGGTATSWIYTTKCYVDINGVRKYTQPAGTIQLSKGTVVASGTYTLKHNSNGEGSFNVSIGGAIYSYGTMQSGTKTWTLNPIVRASVPSFITHPNTTFDIGKIGDTVSIYTNRQSGTLTHTLSYNFKGREIVIATNVEYTTTWTIPEIFLSLIPNNTYGDGTLTCDTYSGSTKIGSKTISFRCYVPASYKPAITISSIVDVNSAITAVTKDNSYFVKGLSKPAITGTFETYGSATRGTLLLGNDGAFYNSAYNSNGTFYSTAIPVIKKAKYSARGNDSRGYRTTIEKEIPSSHFIDYIPLNVSATYGQLTAAGNIMVYIKGNAYTGKINGSDYNNVRLSVAYREKGTTTWTYETVTLNFTDSTLDTSIQLTGLNYTKTYNLKVDFADSFSNISTAIETLSGTPLFYWDNSQFTFNIPISYPSVAGGQKTISPSSLSSGSFMKGNQTVTLTETISSQVNGIVLQFERYQNNAATSSNYHLFFIPKIYITAHAGASMEFFMSDQSMSVACKKRLYIYDNQIKGADTNISTINSVCGITLTNSSFVLTAVYGV